MSLKYVQAKIHGLRMGLINSLTRYLLEWIESLDIRRLESLMSSTRAKRMSTKTCKYVIRNITTHNNSSLKKSNIPIYKTIKRIIIRYRLPITESEDIIPATRTQRLCTQSQLTPLYLILIEIQLPKESLMLLVTECQRLWFISLTYVELTFYDTI